MPVIDRFADTHIPSLFELNNINSLNIVVGRNGAGKSRLLRAIKKFAENNPEYKLSYISPERVGIFKHDPNIENNIVNGNDWLRSIRNNNQSPNFKNVSAFLLRQLELVFFRKMERDAAIRNDLTKTFESEYLNKINSMLTNVSIVQSADARTFQFSNHSGETVDAENLSSGESEAISLASEIMSFFDTTDDTKLNILAIDEPDVHMHPDLQARFARFLIGELNTLSDSAKNKTIVFVATHSTPLICELARYDACSTGTKHFSNNKIIFKPTGDQFKFVAAFFAHPLSRSISDDPLIILEGEDDERVWQQAARTAQGKIKLFPCLANSVDQQTELERFCSNLLPAIYDNPIAFSIRDGDGVTQELVSDEIVKRFRLKCYAIENILLTDDCLLLLGSSWQDFILKATEWIALNPQHQDIAFLQELIDSPDRCRHIKIKSVRQLICSILGSNKPWEVVVGQTIGNLEIPSTTPTTYSAGSFIGIPLLEALDFPRATSSPLPPAGEG